MLYCELCNYYKELRSSSGKVIGSKCDFTGHVFFGQKEPETDVCPCRDMSYGDYLKINKNVKKIAWLCNNYWKSAYLLRHGSFDGKAV